MQAVLEDAAAASAAGEPTDGFAWIRVGYAACQHRNSVFVLGGIHATDVQLAPLQQAQQDGGSSSSGGYSYSEEQLAAVCLSHGVAPTFLSAYFK